MTALLDMQTQAALSFLIDQVTDIVNKGNVDLDENGAIVLKLENGENISILSDDIEKLKNLRKNIL